MNEFDLINTFFKSLSYQRSDVILGIGDDAACVQVPEGYELLISSDTLVSDVHFLPIWDAYDIAWKSVMVNVSDIAAMGASPCWLTLALTLPELDSSWLERFSLGLRDAMAEFDVALIGGDTTRGPLSITVTIHGIAPKGKSIRRSGARAGDRIWISGELGAAAQAVAFLNCNDIKDDDKQSLMEKLLHPKARVDLNSILQAFATAAIDISDGLSADLTHICKASGVGACLLLDKIPISSLVKKYQESDAINFALQGGDDYELCFTVSPENEALMLTKLKQKKLQCYPVGVIEKTPGLRGINASGEIVKLSEKGYRHF